jgi:hypothetical protein
MPDQAADSQNHSRDHVHGARCYWDYEECRWVCQGPAEPVAVLADAVASTADAG